MKSLARFWQGIEQWLGIARVDEASIEFDETDCARFFRLQYPESPTALDEQTWADLMVKSYFDRVTKGASLFGKQIVYRWLRTGQDDNARAECVKRIKWLIECVETRGTLHAQLSGLRSCEVEITDLAAGKTESAQVPAWWPWVRVAPIVMLFSGMLAFLSPIQPVAEAGLIVALTLMLLLFILHMSYVETIRFWDRRMDSVIRLLDTGVRLAGQEGSEFEAFRGQRNRASRLARSLTRVGLRIEALDAVRDYLDWFWLGKLRHYFRQLDELAKQRDVLLQTYLLCGELEACWTLAEHWLSCDKLCWAEVLAGDEIDFQDAIHPLLANPQPLSLHSKGKGIFLSGQNGVGKSTLLRSVGINAIAARTFGFCYASSARLPPMLIQSSIQASDSLLQGESLYISELRRARELLEESDSGWRALYLIDEIFRGTNYLESVAAAASLLNRLADQGTVIASSHNLILGALLGNKFVSQHVAVDETTRQMEIRPGVLVETNGLSLLKSQGFGVGIEADAARVFDWLSQYLVQPSRAASVLEG
jgi:hypothetical protein